MYIICLTKWLILVYMYSYPSGKKGDNVWRICGHQSFCQKQNKTPEGLQHHSSLLFAWHYSGWLWTYCKQTPEVCICFCLKLMTFVCTAADQWRYFAKQQNNTISSPMVRPWKALLNESMVSGGQPGAWLATAVLYSSSVGAAPPRCLRWRSKNKRLGCVAMVAVWLGTLYLSKRLLIGWLEAFRDD